MGPARGPLTAAELASHTGTRERYILKWLATRAVGGYVECDTNTGRIFLNEEQALCLADPNDRVELSGTHAIVQDLFHVPQQPFENFPTGPERAQFLICYSQVRAKPLMAKA